jgi:hypothetical protein
MKINKFDFLKIVGKHLTRKLGNPSADLVMLATSLMPMFNQNASRMMLAGILDEDNRIDVDALEKKLIEMFNITPYFHIPVGEAKVVICKKDIELFLADLKKYSEVDQVIYLPCNK